MIMILLSQYDIVTIQTPSGKGQYDRSSEGKK